MGKWEMALMRGQGINRALVCGIILLGSVHVLFTIGLYGMSRSGVFSNYHDGMGTWNVLSDNRGDQLGAIKLASLLKKNELASWWAVGDDSAQVHIRISSVFYYLFGDSRLSLIPFNTGVYMLLLLLIYQLGDCLFGSKTGMLSAAVGGMLPTFFIQSTQMGKEPLYICGWLLFWLGLISIVRNGNVRKSGWTKMAVAVFGFLILIWTRFYMGELAIIFWVLGMSILFSRMGFNRDLQWDRIFQLLLPLVAFVLIVYNLGFVGTRFVPAAHDKLKKHELVDKKLVNNSTYLDQCRKVSGGFFRPGCWLMRFENMREGFRLYDPEAGSTVDGRVKFENPWDVIRYLPRALQVGFGTPFPSLWFQRGKFVGFWGRAVAGLETAFMYFASIFALFCIWKERKRAEVWLIAFFIICGSLLLGLVVTNAGAIFRYRYAFWMIIIILGSNSFLNFRSYQKHRKLDIF